MKLYFKKSDFFKIKLFFNKYLKFNLNIFSVYNRAGSILYNYINSSVMVHNGRGWSRAYITRWNCGYKYGMFTWNRRRFIQKVKKSKKKLKC